MGAGRPLAHAPSRLPPGPELALGLADRWGVPARPLLAAAPIRRRSAASTTSPGGTTSGAPSGERELAGERIAVVDDVFTTGARRSRPAPPRCAREGAGSVAAVTLARVVRI